MTAREGDRIVFRLRSAEDDAAEAQEAAARAGIQPLGGRAGLASQRGGGFVANPSPAFQHQPVVILVERFDIESYSDFSAK